MTTLGLARMKAREAGGYLLKTCQFFGLLHCIQEYGFEFCTTLGASMEPLLSRGGDVLLYDKCSKWPVWLSRFYSGQRGPRTVTIDSTREAPRYNFSEYFNVHDNSVNLRSESIFNPIIPSTPPSPFDSSGMHASSVEAARSNLERNYGLTELNPYITRGEVVVVVSPESRDVRVCKRVLAVAGDTVKVGVGSHHVVPAGHVWLQGDNKEKSYDSRHYGMVPIGLIEGRVRARLWPINWSKIYSTSQAVADGCLRTVFGRGFLET